MSKLTGKTRYRVNLFRKVVLQVEIYEPPVNGGVRQDEMSYDEYYIPRRDAYTWWRDAKVEDLTMLESALLPDSIKV